MYSGQGKKEDFQIKIITKSEKDFFISIRAGTRCQNIAISPCYICFPQPPLFLLLWLKIQLWSDFIQYEYNEPTSLISSKEDTSFLSGEYSKLVPKLFESIICQFNNIIPLTHRKTYSIVAGKGGRKDGRKKKRKKTKKEHKKTNKATRL